MKQFIFSTLAILGLFAATSCERHEWEDTDGEKGTKRLYPKHEKNHDAHDHDKSKSHDSTEHKDHDHNEHKGHDHDTHNH